MEHGVIGFESRIPSTVLHMRVHCRISRSLPHAVIPCHLKNSLVEDDLDARRGRDQLFETVAMRMEPEEHEHMVVRSCFARDVPTQPVPLAQSSLFLKNT